MNIDMCRQKIVSLVFFVFLNCSFTSEWELYIAVYFQVHCPYFN